MMELPEVRAFVRVAELKSVSAAARALGLPKSSVSRSLSRLEAALGSVLVERSTRHLRLTDAGLLFLPHARRILNDVDEAETALGSFKDVPRGELRVNAPQAFALGLLAPMLPGFLVRYPEVRLVLDVTDRQIDMPVEQADLVIRIGPLADSALIARRLTTLELWACASPAYLSARGTPNSAAELAGHDLVGRVDRFMSWALRASGSTQDTSKVQSRAVVVDPNILKVLLTGGTGIGRLPDFIAADAVDGGELVRVLLGLGAETVDVHALYPSHRSLSAKVRAFIDALSDHLRTVRAVR